MLHDEGSTFQNDHLWSQEECSDMLHIDDQQDKAGSLLRQPETATTADLSVQALQRRRIAQLEEKLQALESGHMAKEKCGIILSIKLDLITSRLAAGADGAQGDDISKLKALVLEWVNHKLKPDQPIDPDDKNSHGFANDACSRLLCPAELDWNNPA
ncbi:hypothetical protein BDR04DRAFT_1118916 [Suillus decipiens]|nr:hypothetical protein BDR04DRAFT_1118916 [Suillus decipiens]